MKTRIRSLSYVCLIMVMAAVNSCKKGLIKDEQTSPVAIFDELWKVMDTKYAMFSYKQVNWQELYTKYRVQISENTTDEALFNSCNAMLEELRDGHVTLISPAKKHAYNGYYANDPHNFNYEILLSKYFPESRKEGALTYQLFGKYGYVHIATFGQDLSTSSIDHVFNQFDQLDGLIIDVRDNSGGAAVKVDQIVEKFIKKRTLLKYDVYKKGSAHDDFYTPKAKYLDPKNSIMNDKPIVVLTNRRCFSSCNDFVLYLAELPNAVIIGDRTGGGGGTPFDFMLPNGWTLKYSASMAVSPSNFNIEDGIMPDFLVSNSLEDENKGNDAILRYALDYLLLKKSQ